MAIQMSLMGPRPVTKDNLVHILKAKEPLTYGQILDELGYDVNADESEWSKAWDQVRDILQPMCKRGEAYYRTYLDWVQHDGEKMGVYNHKFSVHDLPSHGAVHGYEMIARDDDEDDEDIDAYKNLLKEAKEVKK